MTANMDSPWDENTDNSAIKDVEWSRISSEFTNVGYREGITAGKEGALQEGFDSGFAHIGAPIGRELGLLRGISSAILTFLQTPPLNENLKLVDEAQDISSQLSRIRFTDIMPRDVEAEEHARQHLEAEGVELDENEEIAAKHDVEGLEDMLANLTAGNGISNSSSDRPTMEDIYALKTRLAWLGERLHLSFDWN
ncbi:hypothetical protein NLJ89_g4593 [Agrocybe chaxingu]|uniref:Protein YAE1 n=1 Tax=Agrocybe chaxingu TaxID=84603 RepID=A0A9W8MUE8_9AGAR|nr:hypothetical protein NLJ89_g4593 [Agrocybe chaxingu]